MRRSFREVLTSCYRQVDQPLLFVLKPELSDGSRTQEFTPLAQLRARGDQEVSVAFAGNGSGAVETNLVMTLQGAVDLDRPPSVSTKRRLIDGSLGEQVDTASRAVERFQLVEKGLAFRGLVPLAPAKLPSLPRSHASVESPDERNEGLQPRLSQLTS